MRYLSAYLLCQLGGKDKPSASDIETVLSSVGIEHDSDRISKAEASEEHLNSLYDKSINRIIEHNYPDRKACFLSEPFFLSFLFFLPGVLRFGLYYSQLDEQLLHSFTHDHETVTELLLASSYVSMLAIVTAPFIGFIIDFSRRVARKKLEVKLRRKDVKMNDRRIYWFHMSALAPILLVLASLSLYVSATLYVTGQKRIFYTQFVAMTFFGSIFSTVSNTFVMTAYPLKHFGLLMGVLWLVGGPFGLLQYGLIQLPLQIGNGLLIVTSVLMYIPPIFFFFGAN